MDFDELVLVGVLKSLSEVDAAHPHADAVEFQVDTVENPLEQIEGYAGDLPIIVSIQAQTVANKEDVSGYLDVLLTAARIDAVEAAVIDWQLVQDDEELLDLFLETDVNLIIRYCNFEKTPPHDMLLSIIEKAGEYSDAVYIAPKAESLDDTLTLLLVIEEATESGLAVGGVSLGEIGRHTRVIAPQYGSKLAFAPVTGDAESTATGEITLEELVEIMETVEDPTPVTLHESLANHPLFKED